MKDNAVKEKNQHSHNPRFKRSKKLGANRQSRSRLMKLKGISIDLINESKNRTIAIECVTNEKIRLSPEVLEQSSESDDVMNIIKLGMSASRKVAQVAILRELYGDIDITKRVDHINKIRKSNKIEYSLLAPREIRLDVVRQRSGLVVSRAIGKQLIKDGQIKVSKLNKETGEYKFETVRVQSYLVPEGSIIVIDSKMYEKNRVVLEQHQKLGERSKNVPPYREVNYSMGIVGVLRRPKDGEVLLPKYVSLAARRKI